ncbi:MAG: dual specificity protein phosphatase family protein [Sulfolobaceae archaeon]|nr:dual specificity protein phosphatase family protein [Sulfolobaceae archaeon]
MYWVRRGIIGGSHLPSTEYELEMWKKEGVKRVLVLAEDWEIAEDWGDSEYYFSILKDMGFEYLHEPIPDGEAPNLLQFKEIMDWLERGKGNLVHCVAGIGRTGTVIAGYLMITEGYDADEAIYEVRRYQPDAVQTLEQYTFLLNLEKVKEKWQNLTF